MLRSIIKCRFHAFKFTPNITTIGRPNATTKATAKAGAYGGAELGSVVGNSICCCLGGCIGTCIGEKYGEKAVEKSGLQGEAGKVTIFVYRSDRFKRVGYLSKVLIIIDEI